MINLTQLEKKLTDLTTDLSKLSAEEQYELLVRRAVNIIKPDLLLSRLQQSKKTKKPILVKYGIDPTSKDMHLGHIVPVIVARKLMQMGHSVTLLFGDFTALVGDPTGRVTTRPILTPAQIRENVKDYESQVSKFIDLSKVEIAFNSPFYENLTIRELMQIYRSNKLQPLLQREDFRSRLDGLSIAEALYPTLMAIDSLFMLPGIELGGNDQFLNFEITNEILKSQNKPVECAITTELLLGTSGDGSKMSKSKNNYISLRDTPQDVFGKIMSIPDVQMQHYFFLLTDITDAAWESIAASMTLGEINPMVIKKLLARILVTLMHSREAAIEAQEGFDKMFSQDEVPVEVTQYNVKKDLGVQPWVKLLVDTKLVKSNREAREHLLNGALKVRDGNDWTKVEAVDSPLPKESQFIVKLGKRRFAQINIQN